MKIKATALCLMAIPLFSNADNMKPRFSCEMIKEKAVRALCIETRQEQENAAADERKKEIDKDAAMTAARVALRSLKKLDVRVTTGVSYQDYPALLADTKFEVQQFTESPSAKALPEIANSMTAAVHHYDKAHELWGYKFSGTEIKKTLSSVFVTFPRSAIFAAPTIQVNFDPSIQKIVDDLANTYPDIATKSGFAKLVNTKGYYFPAPLPDRGTDVNIDQGIAMIWASASAEVAKTTSLLQQ